MEESLKEAENLLDEYSCDKESVENSASFTDNVSVDISAELELNNKMELMIELIIAAKEGNHNLFEEKLKENSEIKECPDGLYLIHHAIIYGHINIIEILLNLGENINRPLEGIPSVHLSLSLAKFRQKSFGCFLFLLNKETNIDKDTIIPYSLDLNTDRLGRTILHYIIQSDLQECLHYIKNYNILLNVNQLFLKDYNGDTILDYFYIYNAKESFKILLKEYFDINEIMKEMKNHQINFIEKCLLYNSIELIEFLIHFSKENNLSEFKEILREEITNLISDKNEEINKINKNLDENTNINLDINANDVSFNNNNIEQDKIYKELLEILNSESPRNTSIKYEPLKTLLLHHNSSFKHGEIIEEDNLLKRIKRRETQVENPDRLRVLLESSDGILKSDFFKERFHIKETHIKATLADILRVHDFEYINNIKKMCDNLKENNKNNIYKFDSDTYINRHTWDSMSYAAGCVMDAVDNLMEGKYQNAFCAIRPPGHHAGYYGKVDAEKIDCKSSNGFCFINNVAVAASYAKNKYREKAKKIAIIDFDVHHGNGTEEIVRLLQEYQMSIKSENKICQMTINKTVCNPWLDYDDAKDVLFVSIHAFDEEYPGLFYPSSGSSQTNTDKESHIYPGGILNVPIGKFTKFSHCYRNIFRMKVIPRLIKFKPDLIFISAGFDGHENEYINNSYMKLNEFDYRWITEEIMKIAKTYSQGRVISILEGGYNINAGIVSSFAQSVMTHSKFLNIGLNKFNEECKILTKKKRKREFDRDLENFRNFKNFKRRKFNEDEIEIKFDRSRLRSIKNKIDEENLDNLTKPKMDVTPPITPYLNSSKSLNDVNMLNTGFDYNHEDNHITNEEYVLFNLTQNNKSQINIEDIEKENLIKIIPENKLENFKNILNTEDNFFNQNESKEENGNNQYEEIEVDMDDEE